MKSPEIASQSISGLFINSNFRQVFLAVEQLRKCIAVFIKHLQYIFIPMPCISSRAAELIVLLSVVHYIKAGYCLACARCSVCCGICKRERHLAAVVCHPIGNIRACGFVCRSVSADIICGIILFQYGASGEREKPVPLFITRSYRSVGLSNSFNRQEICGEP